ncbi:MAG TPA: hypothetical protein VFD70_27275 [Anaerolineae bacterium]|nr:hypothetical protein [Anaerolineae bacterium]
MARTFYTERDIQDLAARGVTQVEVNDNVYITDAARELMDKLGIRRVVTGSASSYSSNPQQSKSATLALSPNEKQEVIEKVKSGVLARLGPGVDSAVVDQIVRRVVSAL